MKESPPLALQHNGLVAATLLARQGLKVEVYEEKDIVGGACRTEYPFAKAPGLPQSTGETCFLCRLQKHQLYVASV